MRRYMRPNRQSLAAGLGWTGDLVWCSLGCRAGRPDGKERMRERTSNASTRYSAASALGPTALPPPPISLADEATRNARLPPAPGAPGCPVQVLSDAPPRPLPPTCPERAATRPPLPRAGSSRRRAAAPTLESLDSTCPDMVTLRPCA